jgi:two-component system sensor histidine kinase UhpB
MRLRTRLNLVVAGLGTVFVAVLLAAEVSNARLAIGQEIGASNVVAVQLLRRLVIAYAHEEQSAALPTFLDELGRIKRSDIALVSASGDVLYRSPASTYKAGRSAPRWFAKLLTPRLEAQHLDLPGGRQLIVTPDASRAVLDAWDRVLRLLVIALVMLGLLHGLAFWIVGRALAPFPVITSGLARIRSGELGYRLPPLPGMEAQLIGDAFNSMAAAVEDKLSAERKAREAELRLEERREFDQLVEQRLDEERRAIARELHDEFSQSITAIRSLARAICARVDGQTPEIGESAHLIADEAARLHDAMHGLIPRLVPLTLDTLGLGETLENLRQDWQRRHPEISLSLHYDVSASPGASITLAIYRVVQEGLINALRHAAASRINIAVRSEARRILVTVDDDGVGLPADPSRPGCFGLRGLKERIVGLGGTLVACNRPEGGARLEADIPLHEAHA